MAGQITFTPKVGDYVAVARGSFRHSLKRSRFRRRLALALLIAALLGAGISWLEQGQVSLTWVAAAIVAMALWLGVLLMTMYLLIPRRSARLFRQQRSLAGTFSISWSDGGLTQSWENGQSDQPWSDYHDKFETDDVFAFGLNEVLYHFAPKRVMTNDQAADLRAASATIAPPSRRA